MYSVPSIAQPKVPALRPSLAPSLLHESKSMIRIISIHHNVCWIDIVVYQPEFVHVSDAAASRIVGPTNLPFGFVHPLLDPWIHHFDAKYTDATRNVQHNYSYLTRRDSRHVVQWVFDCAALYGSLA